MNNPGPRRGRCFRIGPSSGRNRSRMAATQKSSKGSRLGKNETVDAAGTDERKY